MSVFLLGHIQEDLDQKERLEMPRSHRFASQALEEKTNTLDHSPSSQIRLENEPFWSILEYLKRLQHPSKRGGSGTSIRSTEMDINYERMLTIKWDGNATRIFNQQKWGAEQIRTGWWFAWSPQNHGSRM